MCIYKISVQLKSWHQNIVQQNHNAKYYSFHLNCLISFLLCYRTIFYLNFLLQCTYFRVYVSLVITQLHHQLFLFLFNNANYLPTLEKTFSKNLKSPITKQFANSCNLKTRNNNVVYHCCTIYNTA